jgi:hypothetical protein
MKIKSRMFALVVAAILSLCVKCDETHFNETVFQGNHTSLQDLDASVTRVLAQAPGCVTSAATGSPINLFLWTEYETINPTFFPNLMKFILGNCVAGHVTRLVMRMTSPLPMWIPTASSPFFTQFLAKLHANGIVIELVLFPYLMTPPTRITWGIYGGSASAPLDGVMLFMNRWNALIANAGFRSNFKGIVFDMEERKHGWLQYPAIDLTAGSVARLKNRYGNFELGVSIGWDDVTRFRSMPFVDKWYTQMYDFYDNSGILDRGSRNPFIIYKNNPQGLANYIVNVQIPKWIQAEYVVFAPKILAMWSWQRNDAQCLYIYTNGVCVGNAEFGMWSGSGFNLFLHRIKTVWPAMARVEHGAYHFALLPTAWQR